MTERKHASTQTTQGDNQSWDQVRDAIVQRWPQINQSELRTIDSNADALIQYVHQRVHGNRDEIESLVNKNAPGSTLESVKKTAAEQYERTAEAVGQVYRRTEQQIQERPVEATALTFITGVIVGSVATALFFTSRPQPTFWDNVRGGYRRS